LGEIDENTKPLSISKKKP
jgi:hypothetical protein